MVLVGLPLHLSLTASGLLVPSVYCSVIFNSALRLKLCRRFIQLNSGSFAETVFEVWDLVLQQGSFSGLFPDGKLAGLQLLYNSSKAVSLLLIVFFAMLSMGACLTGASSHSFKRSSRFLWGHPGLCCQAWLSLNHAGVLWGVGSSE